MVCSIGGNIAENSGGAHCLKYGFTIHHVLGLEAVLAKQNEPAAAVPDKQRVAAE